MRTADIPDASVPMLGPVRSVFRASRRVRWRGIAFLVVLVGLSIPFVVLGLDAPENVKPAGPIVAFAAAVLFTAVGLLFARRSWKDRALFVAVHELGIALRDRRGPRSFAWQDIDTVWERPRQQLLWFVPNLIGVVLFALYNRPHRFTLKLRTGEQINFSEGLFDGVEEIGRALLETSAALLVPRANEALERGQRLGFGPLTVDQHGMHAAKKSIPWSEARAVSFDGKYLSVYKTGKRFAWRNFAIKSLPNLSVLLRIMARQTSGRLSGDRPAAL